MAKKGQHNNDVRDQDIARPACHARTAATIVCPSRSGTPTSVVRRSPNGVPNSPLTLL